MLINFGVTTMNYIVKTFSIENMDDAKDAMIGLTDNNVLLVVPGGLSGNVAWEYWIVDVYQMTQEQAKALDGSYRVRPFTMASPGI